MANKSVLLMIFFGFFFTGCFSTKIAISITSEPEEAEIFYLDKGRWQKFCMTPFQSEGTISTGPGLKVYNKMPMIAKKEGYNDSEIKYADGNEINFHFVLTKTTNSTQLQNNNSESIGRLEQKSNMVSNLDSGIINLCLQIANIISEKEKTSVAVLDLENMNGNNSAFEKYIPEEIITRLFQLKKIKVVERQFLKRVISENKLQMSGSLNADAIKKIGGLLSANTIVSGTTTLLKNSIKINLRLINTETAEIFGVASYEINKDDTVEELLNSQQSK